MATSRSSGCRSGARHRVAVCTSSAVALAWGYRAPDAPGQGRIGLARSDDNGRSFSVVQLLDHGDGVPHGAAFPSIAAGPSGVHVVAERIHDAGRGFQGLLHAWAADGETFTDLRSIAGTEEDPGGGRQGLLMRKLVLHPDGRILVVHSTFDQGRRSRVFLMAGRVESDT